MPATQKHRFLSIETPLGEDVLFLHDFTGTETLGRPFNFNLELLSEKKHDIDFNKIVGQNVTVRILLTEGGERYFNGYVSAFAQTAVGRAASDEIYSSYRATMVPWLWLLTRTADCRIFQEMKVPDIIKTIFGDYGFGGFVEDKLTEPYRVLEYCVQYRETAFNFVSRLMEQEGIYYYFKHENGKHMLVLCDSPGAHDPYPGYAEIPFRPTRKKAQPTGYISKWTIEKSIQPGVFTHTDYNFKKPRTPMLEDPFAWPFSQIQPGHQHDDFEVFDYPGEFDLKPEGDQYAKARIQELQAPHEIGSGSGETRGVATGCKFTMKNHLREDQNREYLVTSSSYTASTPEYITGSTGGSDEFLCVFSAIPAQTPYRAPRSTPKPVVQGAQTAVVVGPPGDEIFTDEFGRVKVQFHWDREHNYEPKSSCWIRVAQTWASKKWGTIYIPRIGQEVIVEFLEGDPDHPIITGCVYNADMMPPYDLPAQKVVSGTKTNSTIGGGGYNEFSMDDTKGKEKITTHAQFDMNTKVEHDKTTTVVNNLTITVEAGNRLLTVQSGTNTETIKGDSSHTVQSGNRTLAVQSGTNTETIKGDSSHTVQAGARTVTVTGGDYSATSSDAVKLLGHKGVAIDGQSKGVSLHGTGKGVTIIGEGGTGVGIEGQPNVEVKGKSKVALDSPEVDIGNKLIKIHGNKIELSVGGNSITIDQSGVTITGTMIKSTAMGNHDIKGALVKIN